MRFIFFVATFLLVVPITQLAVAAATTITAPLIQAEISKPLPEHSAMFRWWLPAAEVDEDVIEAQLEAIAEQRFKGVEICIHMGDTRYPRKQMQETGWGSPRWNQLYKKILITANRLGLQVDTTISPAWPAAVPTITPESPAAAKELRTGFSDVFSGNYQGLVPPSQQFSSSLMPPPPGAPQPEAGELGPNGLLIEAVKPANNRERLVAVTAAKVMAKVPVTKELVMAWGDMPHTPHTETQQATLLDVEKMLDISDRVQIVGDNNYQINWVPPDAGQWQIFSFWQRGTEQQNKEGAATLQLNYVVDHLGKKGAEAIVDFWQSQLLDNETRQLLQVNGGALFEDSLELEFGGLVWTPTLLDDFKRLRGYDLTPYLPLFTGARMNGLANDALNLFELADEQGRYSTLGDRIRNDFHEVLTQLYINNHIQPLQSFAASLGLSYRSQGYGLGVDIVRVAAASIGPDGESLGFGPGVQGDDRFRMIAGGAHLAGRPIIADEVGAIANEGYRLTWLDMLQWVDKNLAAGANQMVFHGMAYPDSNSARWPGVTPFGFGLAGYWGPRNPDWAHSEQLAAYLSRVQGLLQRGVAKVDLAILTRQYGTSAPVFADQSLAAAGFTYDIITPGALLASDPKVKRGRFAINGPEYGALIVNQATAMSVATVNYLNALAQRGVKVIMLGNLPTQTPYFKDYKAKDTKLVAAVEQLMQNKNSVFVASSTELVNKLKQANITPAIKFEGSSDLLTARREIAGDDVFFINYRGDDAFDARFYFKHKKPVYQIDPWTGAVVKISSAEDGSFTLPLAARETTLLLASKKKITNFAMDYSGDVKRQTITGWTLQVESWQEESGTPIASDTRKTMLDVGATELLPWRKITALGDAVSGIGYYQAKFDVTPQNSGQRTFLKLASIGNSASVTVQVNGVDVAINLFNLEADVSALVQPGANSINIEVASTLGNRLIEDGAITNPPWDPNAILQYEDYGLIGPVELLIREPAPK